MRLVPITYESLGVLCTEARSSVFWEAGSTAARELSRGEAELCKEAWLSARLIDDAIVGFSVTLPEQPVGTILFAPPVTVAGPSELPTAPPSPDAFLITSLHIAPGFEGIGLEALLIDATVARLMAFTQVIEAFAARQPAWVVEHLGISAQQAGFPDINSLLSAGFRVVAEHPAIPRLRLEVAPEVKLMAYEVAVMSS